MAISGTTQAELRGLAASGTLLINIVDLKTKVQNHCDLKKSAAAVEFYKLRVKLPHF